MENVFDGSKLCLPDALISEKSLKSSGSAKKLEPLFLFVIKKFDPKYNAIK